MGKLQEPKTVHSRQWGCDIMIGDRKVSPFIDAMVFIFIHSQKKGR